MWKVKERNVGNERATSNMHATLVVLCWGYKHSAAGVVDEFQTMEIISICLQMCIFKDTWLLAVRKWVPLKVCE